MVDGTPRGQTRIEDRSFVRADLARGHHVYRMAKDDMRDRVIAARAEHWSWDRIGAVLGVSGETARRRWSTEVKRPRSQRRRSSDS